MAAPDTVEKIFTATGQSANFAPSIADRSTKVGQFNVWLKTASFRGTVQLERSNDNGTTWFVFGIWAGDAFTQLGKYVFTGSEANTSETMSEIEPGTLYRLNCTDYASGTLTASLGGTR